MRLTERRRAALGTVIGMVGALLLVAGTLYPQYQPSVSPFSDPEFLHLPPLLQWFRMAHAALFLGTTLTLLAWWIVRPEVGRELPYPRITALWSLPYLLAPTMTADAFSYADLGHIVQTGHDPYATGLGTVPGGTVDPSNDWYGVFAPYPPLALRLDQLMWNLSGGHPYLASMAERIPAVLAFVLLTVTLPRLLRRLGAPPAGTAVAAWLFLCNPLTVLNAMTGVHEIVVLALTSVALLALCDGRVLGAGLLVGVGILVKQTAAVVLLPMLLHVLTLGRQRLWGGARVLGGAVLSFVVGTWWWGWGYGWVTGLSASSKALSGSPAYFLTVLSEEVVATAGQWVPTVVLGIGAAVAVALVIRWRRDPWAAGAVAATVGFWSLGSFRPWYWLIPLFLIALSRPGARRVMSCVVTVAFLLLEGVLSNYNMPAMGMPQTIWVCWGLGLLGAAAFALGLPWSGTREVAHRTRRPVGVSGEGRASTTIPRERRGDE